MRRPIYGGTGRDGTAFFRSSSNWVAFRPLLSSSVLRPLLSSSAFRRSGWNLLLSGLSSPGYCWLLSRRRRIRRRSRGGSVGGVEKEKDSPSESRGFVVSVVEGRRLGVWKEGGGRLGGWGCGGWVARGAGGGGGQLNGGRRGAVLWRIAGLQLNVGGEVESSRRRRRRRATKRKNPPVHLMNLGRTV